MPLEYEGFFKLIDTSTTHNRLLYRRFMSEHIKENVDIEFSGVVFVQLPFLVESPKIYKGTEQNHIELRNSYKEDLIPNRDKLFVIESKGGKYFIICNRITISKNLLAGEASSFKEDNFNSISEIEKYLDKLQKGITEEDKTNDEYLVLE